MIRVIGWLKRLLYALLLVVTMLGARLELTRLPCGARRHRPTCKAARRRGLGAAILAVISLSTVFMGTRYGGISRTERVSL